jgi:hypothetical protein
MWLDKGAKSAATMPLILAICRVSALWSVADLFTDITRMSASEGKKFTQNHFLRRSPVNVCFHSKRSFRPSHVSKFEGQLPAKSERSNRSAPDSTNYWGLCATIIRVAYFVYALSTCIAAEIRFSTTRQSKP